MAHTCRGTINLAGAAIDAIDTTHFVITNGPSQVSGVFARITYMCLIIKTCRFFICELSMKYKDSAG